MRPAKSTLSRLSWRSNGGFVLGTLMLLLLLLLLSKVLGSVVEVESLEGGFGGTGVFIDVAADVAAAADAAKGLREFCAGLLFVFVFVHVVDDNDAGNCDGPVSAVWVLEAVDCWASGIVLVNSGVEVVSGVAEVSGTESSGMVALRILRIEPLSSGWGGGVDIDADAVGSPFDRKPVGVGAR